MFSTLHDTYFSFRLSLKMSSAICFNLDQSKILSSGYGLTNHSKLTYSEKRVCSTNLKNTQKKREIAHTKQFLPFPAFSTSLKNFSTIFIQVEIVVCNIFQFGSLKFVVWERKGYMQTAAN